MNIIHPINWKEKTSIVDALSRNFDSVLVTSLKPGLEAEVTKLHLDESSYVLKVWNKSSKPNIDSQYNMLKTMFNNGLSVSEPIGWGFDVEGNPVLLTTYDGTPVNKVSKSFFLHIVNILREIHQFPLGQFDEGTLKQYDFINYFYPHIEDHKDIQTLLTSLVARSHLKQDQFIHGDFNLMNILHAEGKYTIIDWTNGQLGDPRYDNAWSLLLVRIYVGERYWSIFHSALMKEYSYSAEEVELFEAIACLRWILLYRNGYLPYDSQLIARVKNILQINTYLNETIL